MNRSFQVLWRFLRRTFSLGGDQERESAIKKEIEHAVEFRGVNVWVLIFAVIVCSIGLNVNSTPVVIGAMLISPLMGPILGIGLALGTVDSKLLRKSAKHFGIMVAVSILASALYFLISPLKAENSELLGRTSPTIWDVLIGFFGGLAGIIATASKERGNVIPGVAIATALMPPLCTAGFGLAIGNARYFWGAFYLFTINSTFICLATLLVVRALRFREKEYVSEELRRRMRIAIGSVVVLLVLPSIYIARNLVRDTLFEQRVERFVETAFQFPEAEVLKYDFKATPEPFIEVTLLGSAIDSATIAALESRLPEFNLQGTRLHIKQGTSHVDFMQLKDKLLEELLMRQQDSLRTRDELIRRLQQDLLGNRLPLVPAEQIAREAAAVDSGVQSIAIGKVPLCDTEGHCTDTIVLAHVRYLRKPAAEDQARLRRWLALRLQADSVVMVVEGQ
ncbi:MAG: membrane protein [Saprospiraceae bacterium]|nr:MAG: membrane protein [Saprospiraceae bacterium]